MPPVAEEAGLGLAWRLARRELRGGLVGFRILLACLAIGVFAISAVGSVSASMIASLDASARDILGGDLEFRLAQREMASEARAWLAARGRVSEVHLLRAMLRTPNDAARALVELKAVDDAYPLLGVVGLRPAMALGDALATRNGRAGIAVDPVLADRLHVKVGDAVALGDATVEIRALIDKEPDSGSNLFGLGPRVFISAASLGVTGLDRPGTLSSVAYRVALPTGVDPASVMAAADAAFPNSAWQVRDLKHASQGIERFVDQTALFLSLLGLTALLVGGVGVANATSSYLESKFATIATLKCLGAPSRLVFRVYLLQILSLSLLGTLLGAAIGATAPWLVQFFAADLLPVPLVLRLFPGPLITALAFGVLTSLVFSLLPLLQTRAVSAARLFRGALRIDRRPLRAIEFGLLAILIAVEAGLTIATASDRRLASWFLVSVAIAFLLFRGVGSLVIVLARHVPLTRPAWCRLAIANLHRPGAPTASVILSLGLGLAVLVAVALVEGSLSESFGNRLAQRAPSFFFIDLQPDQVGAFKALVAADPEAKDLVTAPSLRTRITAIAGIPAAQAPIDPDQRPLIDSDRGLSYAAELPVSSTVTEGRWWPADYHGPPLVSLEQNFAHGLHVKPGDTLTFDVAGREITATVANLRRVDWLSLSINFFTLFAPGALEPAPQTDIATVRLSNAPAEEALAKSVTNRFPNVSAIRVRDGLEALNRILAALAAAIRSAAIVTLITGGLVLAGAVAASHRQRIRDSVILKVLGATRGVIARGLIFEYGLLGLATSGLAAIIGAVAASLLLSQVMGMSLVAGWLGAAAMLVIGMTLTLTVALVSTWRVLSLRTAPFLRED